jgi:hypothetical protein
MTDQTTLLQAVSNAQRILEEYLEPRPHDNERLLNRLVEALDRNEVVTAVSRLRQGYTLEFEYACLVGFWDQKITLSAQGVCCLNYA